MNIQKDYSLQTLNTFGVTATAKLYAEVSSVADLQSVLVEHKNEKKLILGEGSNVVFTQDFDGLVIQPNIKGIKILSEDETSVLVEAMAGENWDEFVGWTVEQGFGGLENLSLIPGKVGTCPVQNIGAYGVEIKDVFESLTAVHLETGKKKIFSHSDCAFGYRDSVFKNAEKGQWCIVSVVFRLDKNPVVKTSYGAIKNTLAELKITASTIADVRQAVVKIRTEKLPDPKKIGNAGSFFKNPVVSRARFLQIQAEFPDMPFYEIAENQIKIPAGWLIDTLGLKGKSFGAVGVHPKQALVLINNGDATGKDVVAVAQKIKALVQEKFAIELEIEVNIL
ncbi:UDP-N-acetylenolpyruvoylglucosamine reductase [bacterium DOLZORAL124_38_8]|nr:MAG: UDP-N-acetylenolpyruvoylglucosamine reductase [bacterium DOLZORAL124_38_8]